jgi:hypothetical protein
MKALKHENKYDNFIIDMLDKQDFYLDFEPKNRQMPV